MAQQVLDIESLTADDLSALEADGLRCSRLAEWSVEAGAREAASLANTAGGVVVVGPADGLTVEALLAAGDALQPDAGLALSARMLATPDGEVGLLGVRECADPPVLAGEDGAIYRRGDGGVERVSTRAALDELIAKRQRLRERAERVIDAQIERTAFGHHNYFSLVLVVTPLLAGSASRAWARENTRLLLESPLARRWDLAADDVVDEGAVVELRHGDDEAGFILIAGNGTLAIGQRAHRPPLDHFQPASELAALLGEIAEVAHMLLADADAGLVLPALFLEGVRDLRLEGADGYGAPCSVDLQRTFLPSSFVTTEAERDALAAEMRDLIGPLFGADLSAGTVPAYDGPVEAGPSPATWHGKTTRTERRMAYQRGAGSAR